MDRHLHFEPDLRYESDDGMYCDYLLSALTVRQQRAVRLFMDGYTQREIALEMGITHQTVCELLEKAWSTCRKPAKTVSKLTI